MIVDCQNCRNRMPSEDLRPDVDGKMVCENCYTGTSAVGQKLHAKTLEGDTFAAPTKPIPTRDTTQREVYLGWILVHANKEFADKLITNELTRLQQDWGWVELVERITDEHVLLRMAAELGYGKRGRTKKHGTTE